MQTSAPCPSTYLETLQDAAIGFMHRHKGQHLGEQQLFSNTVNYLKSAMSANQSVAETVATRAYGELRSSETHYLDISLSTGNVAVIVNHGSGHHHAIPISLIVSKLIDEPTRKRLTSVAQ